MPVIENLQQINDIIKSIALFIQTDEEIRPDFLEYMKTIGVNPASGAAFQSACFTYIFERNLGEEHKSILKIYLEKADLKAAEKKIVKALTKAVSSVYEIKKILKNGFEFYNIINEKKYDVTSLIKMTNFRGLGVGQYIVARIFNMDDTFYLLEISGILPTTRRDDAYRFSVAKIIQNPEIVYQDNPEKQAEIEEEVQNIYEKFMEFFGTDEVLTTNKFADEVIGMFNDYAEDGTREEFKDKLVEPEEYKFFNVSEFNNSYDNFLENSLGGFSSHKETYDVGIIYDKDLGMYAVPFWGTFNKIFEAKNPGEIENYDKCIQYFLTNKKFSANLIKRAAKKHKNFLPIINGLNKTDYTLKELLEKYKSRYLEQKIFSSTTVLYKSKAFASTLGLIEEEVEKPKLPEGIDLSKIGRNDPCPCGSGKKFKKCCGANL